jgi:gliding motility-associated-like protein/fimbrial isopeptide formation D2 family protein/uncharacterized repeat protein (TIGR01451 family)
MKKILHLVYGCILCFGWIGQTQAQAPTLVNAAPATGFIGEQICFPVTYTNTGGPGYGPYTRLILPPNFQFDNATFGGSAQTIRNLGTINVGAPNNFVIDPIAQSNSNSTTNDTIFAPVGSRVILLEYPVGSMVQGGVALISEVCITVAPNAPIGIPVDLCVQGMYQFGNTPTGVNGPIAGSNVCVSITPILFLFDKRINGSNGIYNQVPGGGASNCHIHQYQLHVDIAAAGTLTGPITITDQLPGELRYLGNISLPAGCSAVEPTIGGLGGNLTVTCNGSFAGSTANIDLQVTFDAAVSDTLDETICDDTDITNSAAINVPGSPSQSDAVQTHVEHLLLEHGNNAGGPVFIGQTVQYNIDFRITEYTAGVDAAVITFIVPDGMVYNPASLTWAGTPVNAANVTIAPGPGTGSTVTVDVHTQNGANILPCNSPVLQYTADVNPTYANGDPVLSRDRLTHTSTIVYDLVEGATACQTGAGTPIDVVDISFQKTVNNSPPTGPGRNGQWWPGDVVQYRLELRVPSLDLDDVVISDFFPLPIHDVTDLAATFGTDVRFDPTSCWTNPPITYTIDPSTNGLIMDFGDISDAVTGGCVDIVLLIDIPITTIPFANGLFHSNFMQVNSDNSGADNITDAVLTLIQVGAPDLQLTKGIVSSDNPNVNISPNVTPPNGNATGANAGDQLFFDITVRNIGAAPGYDVQIRDVAPPELTNCALVAPTPVVDGSNNPVAFTGGFTGNTLTINLVSPDDSIGFAGAASSNDQYTVSYVCEVIGSIPSGSNFENTAAVDWASARGVQKFPPITDNATVATATPTMNKVVDYIAPNYSGTNNRASIGEVVAYELQVFVPEGNLNNVLLRDQLDAGLAFVGLDSIVLCNSSGFNNIMTSNAGGFSAVQSGVVFSNVNANPIGQDRVMTLDFGNLTNLDTDNQQDTIKIFYRTIVVNEASNVDGDRLRNNARLEWDNPNSAGGRSNTTVRSGFVTVVEPQIIVTKSFTPNEVLPGNNAFVTITVRNPSTSSAPAFDVNLTDILPTGMNFVAGFSAGGTANITRPPSNGGGTITAQWDTINVGEIYSITFEIQISNAITPCTTLTNCANITWESIADADQPNQPSAFSSNLGVPRTGNQGGPGGAANTYTQDSCANLDVIIDNTFDPFITANTPICEGDRAVLSVQQYSGNIVRYNWTGPGVPAGFNNYELVIDPVTTADTGTYFVFVELDGCVTDTSNFFSLQLRPQPADPVIIPSDTTVCEGSSLQFSTATVANSYQWTGPNGFTANAATTPIIAPVTLSDAGGYTLVITNNQGCSSNPVTSTVTVIPRPIAPNINNNSPICSGDILQLSTSANASLYQWVAPNGQDTITTTSTLSIAPSSNLYLAGNWTLAVINANNCTSQPSATSTVLINSTPANPFASNSGPICEGDAIQLSVNAIAGATYNWYSDPALTNLVATGQNPTIGGLTAANSPISYYVQINSNGCLSDTSSTVVIVNSNPANFAPSYTSLCAGDSLFLLANTAATGYSWVGPSGFVSNLQDPIIANANASNSGSYVVTIQDNNGCSNTGIVQVAVEETPATPVVTSNGPLCQGATLTLNTTTYTGNNVLYNWTTPSGIITTNVATLVINNTTQADSGTYSVAVTVDGCTSLAGNTEVVINANPTATAAANGAVFCEGDALQLSTTTIANSYQWTGPNGFSSTSPNPAAILVASNNAGTYNLVVTNNNGCSSAPDAVAITVNPAPSRPALSSNTPICTGDNLVLSSSSSASSYQWIVPNGQDTITTTNTITINPNGTLYQDGAWSVVIVDANGCASTASLPTQVVINALPNAATASNNGPVCTGANAQLMATTAAGAQYNWYTNRAATNLFATAQNPVVNNITTTTTYYLVVTVNGCAAPLDSTTVTVLPTPNAPNLPADFAVCEGETITLSTTTAASQYNWTGPNGFSSSAQNPAVIRPATLADAGIYTLSIMDNNGCVSQDSSVQVTVNAAPTAPILTNNSALCEGDTLRLATTAIANTYQWMAPNGLDTITTSNNLQILPSNTAYYQSGNWTLIIQNTNACPSQPSAASSVVINSSVNAPIASNNGPVCTSGAVMVSTPSATGATYQWYSDAALTNLIATTASVTINNITRDSSFYVVVNVNGCVSPAGVTTVRVVPTPPAPQVPNDTALCTGEPLALTTTTQATIYNWAGPNGFQSNAQQPIVINSATAANAGTYTLSVIDSNGCTSASNSFDVTVNAAPLAPTIVSNSPVCFGDTLTIGSSSTCGQSQWIGPNGNSPGTLGTVGGSNVLWTRGSQTAIPANNANYLAGNWYMVCIDTLTGCRSISNTITITIQPTPIVSAFNGGAICAGTDGFLSATPIAGASYAWYSDSTLTTLVATTRTATIPNLTNSTTFYVVATVNGCASVAASTTIPVNANPVTPVPTYLPLCQLDTLFLFANAGANTATYAWSGPNGFNSNLENPVIPNAYPFNAGSYTLTVTDSLGCSAFSTVEVTIYPKPATPTITHNAPFCAGSADLTLQTQAYFGTNVQYWWTRPNGTIDTTIVPSLVIANAQLSDTGLYQLQVLVDGCISLLGDQLIRLHPIPAAPAVPADFAVCEGEAIVLSTTTAAAAYFWTGPNGFQSNLPSPTVVNATAVDAGTYQLVVANQQGCLSPDSGVVVTVNSAPAAPTITHNSPLCFGDTLVLTSSSACGQSQWIGPNGNSAGTLGSPGGNNPLWTLGSTTRIPATDPNYLSGAWYMVCIDTTTGCQSISNTINVTITDISAIPVAFNNSPVCMGDAVQLTTASVVGASYAWYSDATLTNLVATVQNPTINNITNDTTFYLTITVNGCTSLAGSTVVRVHPIPAAPSISANFAVCEGDAIVLSTTTQAASYNWTGPNGFQSNQQSPSVVVNASLVDSGLYTLFIIDNNGCQSADTSVFVQVNPIPTTPIITSNNSPICAGNDLILVANAASVGSTYTWYLSNGLPIGTGQTLTLTSATANQAGDYYVTVALNGCESPASAMTTAIIDTIPTVTAFAGADQALCDSSSTNLAATGAVGVQGMWTTTSTATIANPMAANSAVYNLPVGISTFFWTLSSGACRDFSADSMQIDVTPISTDIANAGLDQNLCGQNTATLTATAPTTALGRWTQSSSQAGQGIVITNPNNPTTTVTGLQQGQSYNFTWVLSNGNCGDYSSDVVQINIDVAPPDNAYAGTNILLCNQNSTNLAAFVSQYGTGLWTSTSSATIIDPTLSNTLVINLPQDTSVFVWTLSNGTCQDYSTDTVLVVVSTTNDTADAGLNQVVCSVNAVNLAAIAPAAGTGRWSQTAAQAAQGVVIVTPNDPNSQVVGLSSGTTYAFTWTLSNGTCIDYSSDITTVTVNATPPDNAFAGNDINLCGANTSSNLAATVPTVATGLWTTTSTATISNPTQPNSTVSGLSNGANVFVWTLSAGSCIDYDRDTVIITVTAPSSDIADAGLDSAYCNQSTITLNAAAPSVGGGYWAQTPSQASLGAVINNPTNPNSTVSNLTAGITYTFTWTLTNGGCVDYSSDQTLITIDVLPSNVAYAGEDTVLCGGNATQLNGLVPPIGTGFWTTNDSATITTPTDAQSLVVNINQDTTTYYWTLSNGACVDYSVDSVQVVLSPLSSDIAFAGFDAVLCGVDSIILNAAAPTTSTGVWTQSAGQLSQGVVITDPTNPNSSVTGIVSGQVYTFTWTLSTVGCANFSTDDVTYTINALPPEVAYAGPDIILCSGNSTVMDANNPIFSTGQWSSNSSSAVIINPTLNNSTVVNLPIDTIEFYWSLSNGSCLDYSVDTMLVIVTATTSVDTANAGLDIAICNADTAQLMALTPTVAAGRWIQSNNQASAGVIIDNLTAPTTLVRGLQLDSTYTFTWALSNGPCLDYDTDAVRVEVSSLPTDAAYAGEDFVICGIDTAIVTATTPSVGTGLWTTTSGATIVTPPNTRTELVNLGLGANVFIWTLSNGACTDYSSDTIIITTDDAPVANADSFVLIYNSTGNTIDVLSNDQLNNNWVISITQDIGSGRLTNLGDGTFDILLQDVLVDQQFIYQLCNPNCPAVFCDTALVLLDVQGGTDCVFPNTMTPNNDGVNDAFIVPCLDGLEGTKLTVFNRWGDLLYQNDNYENNWDATHNGAPVPDATYFYIMELADGRKFQGFIEVRR